MVRLGKVGKGAVQLPDHFLTDVPISLGLWVGEGATPNSLVDAEKALDTEGESSPPSCGIAQAVMVFLIGPLRSTKPVWKYDAVQEHVLLDTPSVSCRYGRLTRMSIASNLP